MMDELFTTFEGDEYDITIQSDGKTHSFMLDFHDGTAVEVGEYENLEEFVMDLTGRFGTSRTLAFLSKNRVGRDHPIFQAVLATFFSLEQYRG